jgi:pimeloyl-ACP methyl ester carboxylesterase
MRSLINNIQYGIKLNFIQHQFNRDRNLLIHHGLMGSAKNFRNISKNIAFSKYVNSYLIDARNHGHLHII